MKKKKNEAPASILKRAKLGSIVKTILIQGVIHVIVLYYVVFNDSAQESRFYAAALIVVFLGSPAAFLIEIFKLKARLEEADGEHR